MSTTPAGVTVTPRPPRSSNATPSCPSSCLIATLSAGCDMCSRSEARVMFASSATATQYRTRRSSGCCIESRSLWHQNPPVLDDRPPFPHPLPMTDHITRDELRDLIDNGAVTVVEALGAPYFESGHLPGAINIPHTEVKAFAPRLLPDKDAAIVTYCSNTACQNSGVALAQLRKLGYANVRMYAEGKQDWEAAGLPLDTAIPV